jgi:predicted secreted protein
MTKRLILFGMLTVLAASAWAGDVATFVNLGFSEDSRYFMFAQYGVLEKSSAPYSELYVVDVPQNAFVNQGVRKVSYTKGVEPGSNGQGALFNLMGDAQGLKKQYRIDHLLTGRLLYLLVDGGAATGVIEFRDFLTGSTYRINLLENVTEKNGEVSSSFHIEVSITEKDGTVRSLDVGNPRFQRAGVKSYRVKQIILAPNGKSLVFIIQRAEQDSKGSNIRYMVETARVSTP